MPRHNWYEKGTNNGQCDQCGRIFKFTELMRRWDNAMVDAACFEIRQPQDFIRPILDNQAAPIIRIRPNLTTTYLLIPTGTNRVQMFDGPIPAYGTYLEVYARVALLDWSPTGTAAVIYSQSRPGPTTQSFYVSISTTGTMQITWVDSAGSATNVPSTANLSGTAANTVLYLKWILDFDNGSGGNDAFFYTSTDGITYTQLGATVTTAGVTDIKPTQTPPTIGAFAGGAAGGDPPTDMKIYNVYVNAAPDSANRVSFNSDLGAVGARQFQAASQTYQLFGDTTFVTP